MSGIFISYRRDDLAGFAGRLADALASAFGADNVFRDIEDIHPGQDFVLTIEKQLKSVDVMLVMIGPAWLTASRNGVRRLDEPDDFVRREIQAGLASGKVVLPVLVDGASMPTEKDLPPAIEELARRQSFVLSDAAWGSDVARLVELISSFSPVRRRFSMPWGLAGLVLVALVALGLKGLWPERSPDAGSPASGQLTPALSGRWVAQVKYDWGAEHAEILDLHLSKGEIHGTASYLGLPRMLEQGRVDGEQLSFITHSQEVLGEGPGREVTHRYRGVFKQGELHFVLESSGGHTAHIPVAFVARPSAKQGS
ncbi:toll/interleukin-1 receptor domain-containing protein [Ferribacterium limneticum]|uniref:toll/interleukin-1 receptor domain-containing protein n=1 Tax=Ferribacterium limneticum TaxID=76259 RepID=UPI001CFBD0D9|nr:toll/interleukin-1 receptor domain-containing protein [Ferribacterium limneticum]UCV26980.1 toll/interleukin-1 receptor domain-containing protein [Ferribacterium limneticum]UCV30897.1 toll/interleukin-1 receptor domain-containing protein [Ferribacterium limneticum]